MTCRPEYSAKPTSAASAERRRAQSVPESAITSSSLRPLCGDWCAAAAAPPLLRVFDVCVHGLLGAARRAPPPTHVRDLSIMYAARVIVELIVGGVQVMTVTSADYFPRMVAALRGLTGVEVVSIESSVTTWWETMAGRPLLGGTVSSLKDCFTQVVCVRREDTLKLAVLVAKPSPGASAMHPLRSIDDRVAAARGQHQADLLVKLLLSLGPKGVDLDPKAHGAVRSVLAMAGRDGVDIDPEFAKLRAEWCRDGGRGGWKRVEHEAKLAAAAELEEEAAMARDEAEAAMRDDDNDLAAVWRAKYDELTSKATELRKAAQEDEYTTITLAGKGHGKGRKGGGKGSGKKKAHGDRRAGSTSTGSGRHWTPARINAAVESGEKLGKCTKCGQEGIVGKQHGSGGKVGKGVKCGGLYKEV